MKKNTNKIMGVILIAIALFLIAQELGFTTGVSILEVIISLAFVGFGFQKIIKAEYPTGFICVGLAYYYSPEFLNLPHISFWIIILVSLLLGIGVGFIVGKKHTNIKTDRHGIHFEYDGNKKGSYYDAYDGNKKGSYYDAKDVVEIQFGNYEKYYSSNDYEKSTVKCEFGGAKVYFNDAKMLNESAMLNLEVAFGHVDIYVPRDWCIKDELDTTFSSVDIKESDMVTKHTLILTGEVTFGGLSVHYI